MRTARLFFFLLVVAIMAVACGGLVSGSKPKKKWTVMVYMGADNNLSSAGLQDIAEIAQVGSNISVNLVVQAEFSATFTPNAFTAATQRIYVEKGTVPGKRYSVGTNLDMGSPSTLTDFVKWATATYPADRYALVIWDHGNGWKSTKKASRPKGAVEDDTSGSFMSLPNLAKGVADSGVILDLIDFDACSMGMYEVDFEFLGLTKYLVGSAGLEPSAGDPYKNIFSALEANPDMDGAALASVIVDSYQKFYANDNLANGNQNATTKSAVDMAAIVNLDDAVRTLAAALETDPNGGLSFASAQTSSLQYGEPANHDLCGIADGLAADVALGNTARNAASVLKMAVTQAVIANGTTDGTGWIMSSSKGIAIYAPKAAETTAAELADYGTLRINQSASTVGASWASFIQSYAGAGTASYVPGGFSVRLTWTDTAGKPCDADLDLYIFEPASDYAVSGAGMWYAPWIGATTPNGSFSPESAVSGLQEESYSTNSSVNAGPYSLMAVMYRQGSSCTTALAEVSIKDPANGITTWQSVGTHQLTMSNPYPGTVCLSQPASCYSAYSNYWPASSLARASVAGGG